MCTFQRECSQEPTCRSWSRRVCPGREMSIRKARGHMRMCLVKLWGHVVRSSDHSSRKVGVGGEGFGDAKVAKLDAISPASDG